MLKQWQNIYLKYPTDITQLAAECLWNNKYILCKGKPLICPPHLKQAGIRYLNDLIIDERFASPNALTRKYGVQITFIDLLKIRQCLPEEWKEMTGVTPAWKPPEDSDIFITFREGISKTLEECSAKDFYAEFVSSLCFDF